MLLEARPQALCWSMICTCGGPPCPKVQVHVIDVHSINLRVVDKLELGKEVNASVQVLDGLGIPVLASHFSKMQAFSEFFIISVDISQRK